VTIVIDKDVALGMIVGVIEKFGEDHVYPSEELGGCFYVVHDDNNQPQPGCLIGHALWGMGVRPEVLEEMDSIGSISNPNVLKTLRREQVVIDPEAALILRAAQREQDCGCSWGSALKKAQEVYEAGREP
jgi:hypothetical protein